VIQRRWQVNPREPGELLVLLAGLAGDAGFRLSQRDERPSEQRFAGISHALLHPAQTDSQEAQATFPVGIDLVSQAGEADGKALQAADQDADR
jgi:hypothetical protein